jgi:uridine phosphorylase
MTTMDLPLLEDDLDETSVVNPRKFTPPIDFPRCVVLCFFREVVESIAARPDAQEVASFAWEHGRHPLIQFTHNGQRVGVLQPGVGAPLAVGLMEDVIALGARTFVAVGGAGALVPELVLGHAVVVSGAVRDEGTSFHYLAPSRTVEADAAGVEVLESTLREAGAPFVTGRTWTTDAPYRETRTRVTRRVEEGCLTVEMEASAFIALARCRNVRLAHLLYAGDSLAGPEWDERGWTRATTIREQLFWRAADACLRLDASAPVVGQE